LLNLAKIADALGIGIHELFSYSKNIDIPRSEKEEEIQEVVNFLMRYDIRDVRKVKSIIKEIFKN
jgi:hypothetical protein